MKTQELIHLSRLFEEVVDHSRRDNDIEEIDIDLTDRVQSVQVHKSKGDHKESLLNLAESIQEEIENMDEESEESEAVDAEGLNQNIDRFEEHVVNMDEEESEEIWSRMVDKQ